MKTHKALATGGALLALALAPAVASAGTRVSVRVEGVSKTLLAPTKVTTHGGWITNGGTPVGKCSARSGAGALDVSTHHRWSGTYSSSFGDIALVSILGENHNGFVPGAKYFWEIFVNHRAASTGACGVKLHKGDRLLFAAVSVKGMAYPLGITAPKRAVAGRSFIVKVVVYGANGKPKPLSGAHVGGAVTNGRGIATVTAKHSGTLKLQATSRGLVRSARVKVHVTG